MAIQTFDGQYGVSGSAGSKPSALGSWADPSFNGAAVSSPGGPAQGAPGSPGISGFQQAYDLYSGGAAGQTAALGAANNDLLARGAIHGNLTGNNIAALQNSYNQQSTNLNTANQNNAIDLNNIAGQLGTNSQLGTLAQADVASRMKELYADQGFANQTYGNAANYRNTALGLASQNLGTMMGYLSGQTGFAQQDFSRSNAGNTVQFDALRRSQLADAAGRGSSSSTNSVLGARDIETNRGLAGQQTAETLARANSDIAKSGADAQNAYGDRANLENYRLNQAGIVRDQTQSNLTSNIEQNNNQYNRNIATFGQTEAGLRASYNKLKNIGDQYGVNAQQMGQALNLGISKLGMEGQISALDIANAIHSNDAQIAAVGLQVLQAAMGGSSYFPGRAAGAPNPGYSGAGGSGHYIS